MFASTHYTHDKKCQIFDFPMHKPRFRSPVCGFEGEGKINDLAGVYDTDLNFYTGAMKMKATLSLLADVTAVTLSTGEDEVISDDFLDEDHSDLLK